PPFHRVCPKNMRCKIHRKYATLNRIPNEPPTAIPRGSSPLIEEEFNAPIKLNDSPIKAENPGRPKDAKKAIITKAVYFGMISASPRKFGISRLWTRL